eukprot:356795_1
MSLIQHEVDEKSPHWMDFYVNYQQFINKTEIRPNRTLAVLNIPHKNINAPYAFFIHGSCARMGQFESLIKDLSLKFNVIAFDRIGCGISDKPKPYKSYHDINIFTDLCTIFQTYIPQSSPLQNKKHEILIISHSFGCLQAIKLLSKFGNGSNYNYLVKAVILIGPPSLVLGQPLPFIATTIFSLPHVVLDYISPYLSASFRNSAIHSNSKAVNDLELTFSGWNPSFMFASFYKQIIPCTDKEFETYCGYKINTMVVHGKYDKLCSMKTMKGIMDKLNKYKRNNQDCLQELTIVENASHQSMQEQPKIVLDAIGQFWSKCFAH